MPPIIGFERRARQVLLAAGLVLLLGGCAELMPLRDPPLQPSEDYMAVETRAEAVQRFGPPHEIRSSDVGPVLVYRRAVVIDATPNRYYGEENPFAYGHRYEKILLYLDGEGRIVRRAIEPD
jgi:hypothetical protein